MIEGNEPASIITGKNQVKTGKNLLRNSLFYWCIYQKIYYKQSSVEVAIFEFTAVM